MVDVDEGVRVRPLRFPPPLFSFLGRDVGSTAQKGVQVMSFPPFPFSAKGIEEAFHSRVSQVRPLLFFPFFLFGTKEEE